MRSQSSFRRVSVRWETEIECVVWICCRICVSVKPLATNLVTSALNSSPNARIEACRVGGIGELGMGSSLWGWLCDCLMLWWVWVGLRFRMTVM